MAIFRKIHVTYWGDPFIQSLTPEQKYFYLYILSNEHTKQCGIYEITLNKISFDTGYNLETVTKLIKMFVEKNKIKYNKSTNEIAIKNWAKYNDSKSPKVRTCIENELKTVKDRVLIEYLYSIDTQTQQEEEQEEEQEKGSIYRCFKHLKLSNTEFNKLKEAGYSKEDIDTVLNAVENYKENKKYTSLYLTALDWLKRRRATNSLNIKSQKTKELI